MKRFLVFAGDTYYPVGGMDDFLKDFDSMDEALKYLLNSDWDWAHVYDQQERKSFEVKH